MHSVESKGTRRSGRQNLSASGPRKRSAKVKEKRKGKNACKKRGGEGESERERKRVRVRKLAYPRKGEPIPLCAPKGSLPISGERERKAREQCARTRERAHSFAYSVFLIFSLLSLARSLTCTHVYIHTRTAVVLDFLEFARCIHLWRKRERARSGSYERRGDKMNFERSIRLY